MDKQVVKRRLRITTSIFFALVAAAFSVLWVRSHSCVTNAQLVTGSGRSFQGTSRFGKLYFHTYGPTSNDPLFGDQIVNGLREIHKVDKQFEIWKPNPLHKQPRQFQFSFGATKLPGELTIRIPYWFVVVISGAVAVAVGVRRPYQFSLRTMLIATTLFAVVLGLACYTVR